MKIRGVVHLCRDAAVGLSRVTYQALTDTAAGPVFLVCDRDRTLQFFMIFWLNFHDVLDVKCLSLSLTFLYKRHGYTYICACIDSYGALEGT